VLSFADLSGADLSGANLTQAQLGDANIDGARYTHATRWPSGFDPTESGALLVEEPPFTRA
jgi:uncharacterized protein YjbI with pentapeptide repeats